MKSYENIEFEWGVNDCCLFSANVIKDNLGLDLAKDFRGKYSTEEGAYNLIYNLYDTKDLKDVVSKITELEPCYDFSKVKTLDLVLYNGCIGINYGARSYFLGEKGIIKVPNSACECYWRIETLCHRQQQL